MTLRYGLIGAGMMGQEHIRNLALLGDARIAALADPDPTQRAQALRVTGPDVAEFADHRALLAAGGLDALIIAAPNHVHLPILKDALAGDLPILCEKPLGLTQRECEEIERRAEGRRAPVWVAMEYRYMPAIARLIEEVAKGTAGRVQMLSIREHRFPFLRKVGDWNRFADQTGGTLVEKCCHFFDLMRLILKAEPLRVFATGGMAVTHLEERYGGRAPDILDHAYVVVDFDTGARAMLELCMFAEGAEWQEEVTATGSRARIDARMPGPTRFEPDGAVRHGQLVISPRGRRGRRVEEVATEAHVLEAGDHHGSTFRQHQEFRAMLQNGGVPAVDLRDGTIAVAGGAAAEESARTGRVVDLPDWRGLACTGS